MRIRGLHIAAGGEPRRTETERDEDRQIDGERRRRTERRIKTETDGDGERLAERDGDGRKHTETYRDGIEAGVAGLTGWGKPSASQSDLESEWLK